MRLFEAVTLPQVPRGAALRSIRQIRGRDRSLPHLGRKFYHFLMGSLCFALYAFALSREEALLILGLIGGPLVVLDIFRLRDPKINAIALRVAGGLMRREELKSISGNSFYILGLFLIVLVFPKPIVLMSVLFLAIGDPIAAIVGTRFGRTRLFGKKSAEGALANLMASGTASFLVSLLVFETSVEKACLLGGIGGLVSVIAELAPLPIDDNFTIPVLSAILLSVLTVLGVTIP